VIDRPTLRDEGVDGQTLPLHRVPVGELRDRVEAESTQEDGVIADDPGLNSLRIEGKRFALELEGDAEFINTAYDAVRDSIISRLRTTVTGQFTAFGQTLAPEADRNDTVETDDPAGGYVWVYVCHALYRKVHVVSRAGLQQTPITQVLDPFSVARIYVDRKDLIAVSAIVGSGKTLWSELTEEGRTRLSRGKQ
jgi:hypothetical protein